MRKIVIRIIVFQILLIVLLNASLSAKQVSEEEKEFWELVKSENTLEYYKVYKEEYSNGYYVNSAKKEINKLEKLAWGKIKNSHNGNDFSDFINNYSDSKYVKLAKLKLKKYSPIFIDNSTNLIWQDETYTKEEKNASDEDFRYGKVNTWGGAIIYCNNLSYAGYKDWYLPNSEQLKDLYIQKDKLINVEDDLYWSSSKVRYRYSSLVSFSSGHILDFKTSLNAYTRCVREIQ